MPLARIVRRHLSTSARKYFPNSAPEPPAGVDDVGVLAVADHRSGEVDIAANSWALSSVMKSRRFN